MPCTRQLTDAVLEVEDYTLHSDGCFVKAAPHVLDSVRGDTRLFRLLLDTLNRHCEAYFEAEKANWVVNYEDLLFAASQIEEHLSEEYENPAIEPFAERILMSLQLEGDGPADNAPARGEGLQLHPRCCCNSVGAEVARLDKSGTV